MTPAPRQPQAVLERHSHPDTLLERILAAKRADVAACLSPGDGTQVNVSAWEPEIDGRVYRLYGLTPEEIKIVEEERVA